jgi:hypothetical protein
MADKETKTKKVREHLIKYGKITGLEALELYGLYRLAPAISKFRAEGMDITTIQKDGCGYATYWLNKKGEQ